MRAHTRTEKKLELLKTTVQRDGSMLIMLQDYPDPDAIASAAALKRLFGHLSPGVACTLSYGGAVGRAENRALVRYLDLPLREAAGLDPARFDLVAMVDAQPGAGNQSLPAERLPDIVIDHHPIRTLTRRVPFTDIRSRCGATSTILYEYLAAAGIEPSIQLATALTYGIQSDTADLGRKTTQADIDAFLALYPLANARLLARIRSQPLPISYFRILDTGLRNARLFGDAVATQLGPIDNPDMAGEVADLLLRNEASAWALCSCVFRDRMLLSLRRVNPEGNAAKVMQSIVHGQGTGGGHYTMAGGQITLASTADAALERTWSLIVKRFRKATHTQDEPEYKLVASG